MKNHFLKVLILSFCTFAIAGCSSDDTPDYEYRLDDIELNFGSSGKTVQLDLDLDDVSNYWHVYSPSQDTWLVSEVIPGHKSIYVTVSANESADAQVRSSYIMVRNGTRTQKIDVTQDKNGTIELSQTFLPVRYLNTSATITILNKDEVAGLEASVDAGQGEWCSVLLEDDKLYVNAQLNATEFAREALITVTGKRAVTGETRTAFLSVYQGKGGMTPYVFDIPDFSESKVYKVMDGGKQVAQITREFLRSVGRINAQAVVVYPVENDEVDLKKGYVARIVLENTDLTDATFTYAAPVGAVHGGTVSFDAATNSISGYSKGTLAEPVTKIYMPGDVGMGPEYLPGCTEATVIPHVITDVRNAETKVYPIVKIGAQYWMGKHLDTRYYNANKSYATIPTNITTGTIAARKVANSCIYSYHDADDTSEGALTNRSRYGLLYSFLTIGGFDSVAEAGLTAGVNIVDNISPAGWIVPAFSDLTDLRSYISQNNAEMSRLRCFIDYATGNQIFPVTNRYDDNITGFDAPNSNYRATSSWPAMNAANGCWIHSRTYFGIASSNEASYMFHMNSIQQGQQIDRAFSIRSMSDTAVKIKE